MARIFITGGCGFIGSHLAAFHLNKGDEVLILDDLSSGSLDNLKEYNNNSLLRIEKNNILHWSEIKNAVKWADCIYHLAAIVGVFKVLAEPVNVIQTNIGGCERLLHAMAETRSKARVLLASSSSVYGSNKVLGLSETDNLIVTMQGYSLSTYTISKISQEAISLAYYRAHGLAITLLRLFNVIGPRQVGRYGMVVPRFVEQACNHEPLTVFGDGSQTRSFCDVRDAVRAMDLLVQTEDAIGEIFNVGNNHEISIKDLAQLIKERTGSKSRLQFIPYEDVYGSDFKDITQRRPDLRKLYKLTQFKPEWDLTDSIDDLTALQKSKAN